MPTDSICVDILLGTYNGAAFLTAQLESLLLQTHQNWRLWMRDDASSDATLAILQRYAQQFPERCQLIQDDLGNVGIINNYNILLRHSQAQYLLFCDQDDVWLPNKISHTLKLMLNAERDYVQATPILVHTDLQVVDAQLHVLSESFWRYQNINSKHKRLNRQVVQNNITGCTVMINRALADLAFPVDSAAIMHDWWLGLVAAAFGVIIDASLGTVLYRQHQQNDTGAKRWSTAYIFKIAFKRYDILPIVAQAHAFFKRYVLSLQPEQQALLQDFSKLPSLSYWSKRRLLVKYGLYKHGWLRNLGFIIDL